VNGSIEVAGLRRQLVYKGETCSLSRALRCSWARRCRSPCLQHIQSPQAPRLSSSTAPMEPMARPAPTPPREEPGRRVHLHVDRERKRLRWLRIHLQCRGPADLPRGPRNKNLGDDASRLRLARLRRVPARQREIGHSSSVVIARIEPSHSRSACARGDRTSTARSPRTRAPSAAHVVAFGFAEL
jgi:hypothetical protein